MALELKQSLRMSQQLVMTPQLQQAIKLLQLSRLELVDLIRSEMEQNPLLEEPQDGAETELNEAPAELISTLNQSIEASEHAAPAQEVAQPDLKKANEGDVKREDIDWEQYLDNYQTQHTAPSAGGFNNEDLPSLQDTLTRAEDLTQHLMEQLRMAGLSDKEERIGALIIGNLNRDGYLVVDQELLEPGTPLRAVAKGTPSQGVAGTETAADSPATNGVLQNELGTAPDLVPREVPAVAPEALEALRRAQSPRQPKSDADPLLLLALEAGVPAAMAERVLKRIQRFDPIGCGARDLRECLWVQAKHYVMEGEGKDDPDAELLPQIVSRHLKNVETKKYQAIAKDLHVSLEEVVASIKLIGQLDPKPGRGFANDEPQYITPDVYIHKIGENYVTVLNDDGLSKLRISQHYRNALKNGGASKTKEYIQEKLRSAVWLIRSIHQRQRTIVKVTDSIIKFQRDFLDKGIAFLKPLILRDVAEDIGMHESTVSRVTTNKYVHTPQGIYELKFFFNSSISRVGGEDIASEAVKNQIKLVVAGEPGDKPYSDQKIVEILRSQNVDIARRTVAKYREVLGILPSSKRKRFF
jgi:RNA polymerase sigma-54 factor